MADLVVSEGYAALGYEYINVDDCWLEKSRGPQGQLVADRKRFPRGMRSLSDYVINSLIHQFNSTFHLTRNHVLGPFEGTKIRYLRGLR